ncbi:peptidoglycan-binding domain-containing protein [Methanobacterium sp.]|uniref:peptidoglycan-binding domain-containing protein n=1 Tax=Methanobacterium sp. TaxID=2164 RepID=UPI003C77B362
MSLDLEKGAEGKEVKELQRWLNVHGYNAGEEDGVFGDRTRAAVIQFQGEKDILTNGIVSHQTQVVMERISKQELDNLG